MWRHCKSGVDNRTVPFTTSISSKRKMPDALGMTTSIEGGSKQHQAFDSLKSLPNLFERHVVHHVA